MQCIYSFLHPLAITEGVNQCIVQSVPLVHPRKNLKPTTSFFLAPFLQK